MVIMQYWETVQMRACHELSCDHSDLLLGLVCLPQFVCAERLAVTVVAVECLITGLFEWELLHACSLTCSVLVPCQRIRDFHRLLCTSLSQWTVHVSSILAVIVTCLELLLMVRCVEWTTRLLARQISTIAKTIYFPRAVTIVKYHEIKSTCWPEQAKDILRV